MNIRPAYSGFVNISRPAEYFTTCYTVLKRPNKVETAVHSCNLAFSFGLYRVVAPLSFLRSISLASLFSRLGLFLLRTLRYRLYPRYLGVVFCTQVGPSVRKIFRGDFFTRVVSSVLEIIKGDFFTQMGLFVPKVCWGDFHFSGAICALRYL